MATGSLPPLALIAGPTASGKSALALALAEALAGDGGATIVNADASQLYRDLRILTARPSPPEEARAPHRLFGTRDGADPASAADWAASAKAAIGEAHDAGRIPILVGGTGLYIRTLLDGIAPVPEIDAHVRAYVRALPVADAYAALAQEDAPAAARLRPTDATRVARALEVMRSTGRPLAKWHEAREGGIVGEVRLAPIVLLPDRDVLRTRCDARFLAMLEGGAITEVEALLARGLAPALPVMRAIGVGEIGGWLRGETDRPTMIVKAQTATRRYVKRQTTWLAHQIPTQWPRSADRTPMKLVIKLRNALLTR